SMTTAWPMGPSVKSCFDPRMASRSVLKTDMGAESTDLRKVAPPPLLCGQPSSARGLMISKIGQIAVTCQDVERATAFYRDKVGLKHLFSAPPSLSFFDVGGTLIMLGPPEGEKKEAFASILHFDVDDIQQSYEELKRTGVSFR